MKIMKYIICLFALASIAISCTQEKYDDLSFIENAASPSDLSAIFDITQDNSGLVTITPTGAASSFFDVYFGDDTESPESVQAGKSVQHNYAEGDYNVRIVAHNSSGQTAEKTIPLTVSFRTPENFEITAENDAAVSKKVNITATADYASAIEVYFGESTPDVAVLGLPGEPISHTYTNPGDYEITVVAKSGGLASLDSTFTFTVAGGPAGAAPTPPARRSADVISVFSDAYTNLNGTNFNPNWGQSTVVNTIQLAGNNTLKYSNLNYQGTEYTNTNVSTMDYLHVDLWTEDATMVEFYCISPGAEKPYSFTIEPDVWKSYDIPLSHFSDVVNLTNLFQFKVVGTNGSSVYFDNIYFYRDAPTAPTTAAPTPPARTKVISIFSGAYTDLAGTDFNPNWGQSTVVTNVTIEGNNTLKYANFNYQGTAFLNPINASSMGYLHVDMWTYDATSVNIYPISPGKEKAYAMPITSGEWVSYDIPLTKFSDVVNLAEIIQFKFDGTGGSTIYLDNIYFY